MRISPDLTLILPCFNESPHIEHSMEKIIAVLNSSKFTYEIILIDDKSTDNTKKQILTISKKYKHVRFIFHNKNVGRGGTVQEGIQKARGDIVGFIDIDLEVRPNHIPYFVELIKEGKYDIVIGSRQYPFKFFPFNYLLRTILSLGYSLLIKIIFNLPVKDTETGYKFFKRDRVLPVLRSIEDSYWFWDTEIIVRSSLYGLQIHEEEVLHIRNKDKKSTIRLVPDIIAYLKSLWKLRISLYKKSLSMGALYISPRIYSLFMRMIYGKKYKARYKNITKLIKQNSSVVDVCCGDCIVYEYLKIKNIDYLGLDISPAFIWNALKKDIPARLFDLRTDTLPQADYIILQGSLYQFKNPEKIIKKLYTASRKSLIIAETIHTLAKNSLFAKTFLKRFGSLIVNTEKRDSFRFDKVSLKKLLVPYKPRYIENGKEIIASIAKQ